MEPQFYVYILASRMNGTLYTGFTGDLPRRVWEHRNHVVAGFTKTYNVTRLVHYEVFGDYDLAARREFLLKRWRRVWKVRLIEAENPSWRDLYEDIADPGRQIPSYNAL